MGNAREEEPGWTWLKNSDLDNRLQMAKSKGQTLSLVVFNGNQDDIYKMINDPYLSAKNLLADVIPVMKQYGFTDLNLDI